MTTSPVQLPLFPGEVPPLAESSKDKGLAWSYSRRTAYEQCARRYYYTYFGGKSRSAQAEANKELIQFLGAMRSRYLFAGDILHRAVKKYLRRAQTTDPWTMDQMIGWARYVCSQDRIYSRAVLSGQNDRSSKYPNTLLLEYFYQCGDYEGLYDEIEERLVQSLSTFVTSPKFADFRLHGSTEQALVEEKLKVTSLPYQVTGRVDLAYQVDDSVTIVDWKSGGEDNIGEDSLQLGVYALWAMEHYRCSPEVIQVYKAYLGTDSVSRFTVDNHTLARAKGRIIQDAERLAALDPYGKEALAEAFTPCFQPAVCNSCPFQRICYA